ncbi:MAG: peptidyl-prolyl cis-trans isomerase [Candidatus Babeliaceae bacterium]
MNNFSFKYATFTLSLLLLLPGCNTWDYLKDKLARKQEPAVTETAAENETPNAPTTTSALPPDLANDAVITLEGKTVVNGSDFDKQIQMISQARPEIGQFLPLMPEEQQMQLLNNIADSLIAEQVTTREVKRLGLDQTPEFKEQARQVHEMLDRQLAQSALHNELLKSINITDEDAKKYYEANRDTNPLFKRPPFMMSAGGVRAEGIQVNTEKEAQDILAQTKKGTDFAQLAQNAKSSVTAFGTINAQSMNVDANIRKKAQEVKTFSAFEVIKGMDNKYWVVKFIEKVETQAAPFEQVKDKVKEIMTQNKFTEIFTKKVDELKAKYNAKINKDFMTKYLTKAFGKGQPESEMIMDEASIAEKPGQ